MWRGVFMLPCDVTGRVSRLGFREADVADRNYVHW
jgi:hypothetical protein